MSRSALAGLIALFAVLVSVAQLGSWMNGLYYARFSPFFDSMMYSARFAEIWGIAREAGTFAAVRQALDHTTVWLPLAEAAVVQPFVRPSRPLLVWVQVFWVALMTVSLYWYLVRHRDCPPWYALGLCLPFFSFYSFFYYNGGISDFRMDLRLYLTLALVGVWYLATLETERPWPWVAFGLAVLVAVFSRATAPVYLAGMFGPPLLLRLVLGRQDERTRLVKKLAQVGLPVALLAGWYFWRNWPYLHYYYFVWGADPTAGLPLSQSIQHFHRALWNLGYGLFFVAVVILVLNLWFGLQSPRGLGLSTSLLWRVDWKLLYMAIAPPAFLALNGAGLNPFVAMPAIFGFLCFCLFPLRGKVGAGVPSVVKVLICAGLAAFSVHNVRQGHSSHVMPQPHFATMASVTQGIVQMFDDTRRRNKRELNFTTSHLADFQASMIRNVLYFEFAGEFVRHAIRVQDLTVRATHEHLFSPAVPISWHEIAGRTDEEKYSTLVQVALADLDYIFLPDEPTLDFLEKHKRHNFINVKVRGLKRRLLATGRWKQVGEPIRATPNETVVLYGKAMVGAQNRSTVSHTTGTTCQAPAGSLVS